MFSKGQVQSSVPVVSVIIPTYNRAHILGRSIRSVLNQTYRDFEIVVVDDGSMDNTEDVVRSFNDERIKYIGLDTNRGVSAARNTGINMARGTYIGLLDDDDEWLESKLLKQVQAMKGLPQNIWGGVYCGILYIRKDGKVISIEATKQGNLKQELLKCEVAIWGGSTPLFRRDAMIEVGLFDEDLKCNEDPEFLIRFSRRYNLCCIREPLAKVYGHDPPPAERVAEVKPIFLRKLEGDIRELGEDGANKVFAKHWLEVHMRFVAEKKVRKSLYYLKKSLRYKVLPPRSYLYFRTVYFGLLIGCISHFRRRLL